jgi:hypothetical protein
MRERRTGKGASLGKEALLADSGRAGKVPAGGWAGEKTDFFSILLEGGKAGQHFSVVKDRNGCAAERCLTRLC